MNVIYQHVDRSFVTTGLLLDYGLLFADVAKFNGTLQSNNYVNRTIWSSLYSSLYFMTFNTNATLTAPANVNTLINNYLVQDGAVLSSASISTSYLAQNNSIVNLIGLHYQYEQFKTTAATGNLVNVVNGQIYDTHNRPSTPYEIHDAFAITSTTTNLQGNTHTFRLRTDLFLRNNSKSITSFQADFGDGLGMRTVGIGSDISISYSSDGAKNLVFSISYSDGQTLQSQTTVNVSGTTRTCNTCRFSNPPAPLIFPNGSNFPLPPTQMGTASVTVATAGTDGILDKPLIFVEGFDPLNQYDYYSLLDPTIVGNLTIQVNVDFQGETLAQLLEANNYDLVFVNFNNNSDDIKKNAYIVENLIYWVNQQVVANGSTNKNVVVGASMGGLVARYALRDMELRNVNHNTRLYCSLDSPHQGANVPLGFQAAVRYLAGFGIFGVNFIDLAPQLGTGVFVLNSPAASQMLTYQLSGTYDQIAINNSPHTSFQNDYSSAGMPRLWGIRTLAIANGSECATTQGYSPYSQMMTGNSSQDFGSFIQILELSVWQAFQK